MITLDDERGLEWLEWSDDGQLLAVATPAGINRSLQSVCDCVIFVFNLPGSSITQCLYLLCTKLDS